MLLLSSPSSPQHYQWKPYLQSVEKFTAAVVRRVCNRFPCNGYVAWLCSRSLQCIFLPAPSPCYIAINASCLFQFVVKFVANTCKQPNDWNPCGSQGAILLQGISYPLLGTSTSLHPHKLLSRCAVVMTFKAGAPGDHSSRAFLSGLEPQISYYNLADFWLASVYFSFCHTTHKHWTPTKPTSHSMSTTHCKAISAYSLELFASFALGQ